MGKKYIIGCLALFTLLLGHRTSSAQDPEFTQFYANPLYLNPAFAGTQICPRVSLNYRNQWPQLQNSFVTYSAAFDKYVRPLKGGVGLLVTSDQAGTGTLTTNSAALIYSYQIPITRKFSLQAGAQVNYTEKRIDWDELTFGDMIDARRGFVYETQEQRRDQPARYPDFSFGALGYSQRFFGGFAVHHLTEPDESVIGEESQLPRKFTVHGGAVIPVRIAGVERGSFSPNIMYRSQGNSNQINFGVYGTRGPVVGGLWFRQTFRNSDSFIALIGLYQDTYKVGYSYDITVSPLSNQESGGSHELSFTLQFGCRAPKRKLQTDRCPQF